MTLENYLGSWVNVVNVSILSKVLNSIDPTSNYLCPSPSNILRAFELCSYNKCSVVMLGQDPYPQKGVATGILFGNKKETPINNISPSLRVIMNAVLELDKNKTEKDFDITLEGWAKQGVLMLNTALTTEVNKIGIHTRPWYPFINDLLINMKNKKKNMVYVAFGTKALNHLRNANIIGQKEICLEYHPSYYARINHPMHSTIFNNINLFLREKNKKEIKWL